MDEAESPLSPAVSAAVLIGLLLACFGVAAVGGGSTMEGVTEWYPTLDKPPWTPPNWAFGPIWTVLYTAMAVAAWDVVRTVPDDAREPMTAFAIQLVLNLAWSPAFFAWQQVGLALCIISGMWVAIAACIRIFLPISTLSAGLMAPYLLWVSIAWSLNAWIWWFN